MKYYSLKKNSLTALLHLDSAELASYCCLYVIKLSPFAKTHDLIDIQANTKKRRNGGGGWNFFREMLVMVFAL